VNWILQIISAIIAAFTLFRGMDASLADYFFYVGLIAASIALFKTLLFLPLQWMRSRFTWFHCGLIIIFVEFALVLLPHLEVRLVLQSSIHVYDPFFIVLLGESSWNEQFAIGLGSFSVIAAIMLALIFFETFFYELMKGWHVDVKKVRRLLLSIVMIFILPWAFSFPFYIKATPGKAQYFPFYSRTQ
jgi:hypothetical protein